MLTWYNLGGLIRGYQDGGTAGLPQTIAVDQTPVQSGADLVNPITGETVSAAGAVGAAQAPAQFQTGYNPQANWTPDLTVDPTSIDSSYVDVGAAPAPAPNTVTAASLDVPNLAGTVGQNPVQIGNEYSAAPPVPGGYAPEVGTEGFGNEVVDPYALSEDVVETWEDQGLSGVLGNEYEEAVAAGVHPNTVNEQIGVGANAAVTGNFNPVANYIAGPGGPGVNTGIPQGGHAANAIASYFAGGQGPSQLSYTAPATSTGVDYGQLDEFKENLAGQSQAIVDAAGGGGSDVAVDPVTGTIETLGGGEIAYDSPAEQVNAENIAEIIEEGGINPETGDPNIVAGPNVLGAADEGFFGIGADYNQEFQENYEAQSDHAEANPYGQTTGTPIYEQGYAEPGGFADTIINNSLLGTIGGAITGENLLPTYDDLLPPAEAFTDSGDDDDDGGWQNDGDPTNDQGNAGWGFTSISDMFDGGGPGQSGDSYSGGIHGDNTVGDTSEGFTSVVSDWFGGGSDDNDSGGGGSDSGGGGGGGYGCYVATALRDGGYWSDIRRLKLLSWCMKAKPEGKLDTLLWRNGYTEFGKKVIAPRVDNKVIQWLSDGFYDSTVRNKLTMKSIAGKLFFYVPSYGIGLWKAVRGKLVEIERT